MKHAISFRKYKNAQFKNNTSILNYFLFDQLCSNFSANRFFFSKKCRDKNSLLECMVKKIIML